MGLLLLRAMLGGTLVAYGAMSFAADRTNSPDLNWLAGSFAILIGGSLFAGLLTPVISVLVCLAVMTYGVARFFSSDVISAESILLAASLTTSAAAVVMLGPGAISVDAHLFGRREIVIPKKSRQWDK